MQTKVDWQGKVTSVQPRTRVWRYVTDNRTHYHLGYNIFLKEAQTEKEFVVAISEKQFEKGLFRIGDVIKGTAWTKLYPEREYADFIRAGALKHLEKAEIEKETDKIGPPWTHLAPELQNYEERGARMLSLSRWKSKCFPCVGANMANVEIQWDFDKNIKKYRFEAFCYGPKDCKYYKMGRARSVPYKGRESALDDGVLDELCTEGRD